MSKVAPVGTAAATRLVGLTPGRGDQLLVKQLQPSVYPPDQAA